MNSALPHRHTEHSAAAPPRPYNCPGEETHAAHIARPCGDVNTLAFDASQQSTGYGPESINPLTHEFTDSPITQADVLDDWELAQNDQMGASCKVYPLRPFVPPELEQAARSRGRGQSQGMWRNIVAGALRCISLGLYEGRHEFDRRALIDVLQHNAAGETICTEQTANRHLRILCRLGVLKQLGRLRICFPDGLPTLTNLPTSPPVYEYLKEGSFLLRLVAEQRRQAGLKKRSEHYVTPNPPPLPRQPESAIECTQRRSEHGLAPEVTISKISSDKCSENLSSKKMPVKSATSKVGTPIAVFTKEKTSSCSSSLRTDTSTSSFSPRVDRSEGVEHAPQCQPMGSRSTKSRASTERSGCLKATSQPRSTNSVTDRLRPSEKRDTLKKEQIARERVPDRPYTAEEHRAIIASNPQFDVSKMLRRTPEDRDEEELVAVAKNKSQKRLLQRSPSADTVKKEPPSTDSQQPKPATLAIVPEQPEASSQTPPARPFTVEGGCKIVREIDYENAMGIRVRSFTRIRGLTLDHFRFSVAQAKELGQGAPYVMGTCKNLVRGSYRRPAQSVDRRKGKAPTIAA